MANTTAQTGYAPLKNGLNMYYEIHGAGRPLLLMHGGFMTIDALGPLLPALAQTRQVIAVELEGHGRTADLDRPLSYEQMAEDVAGLLGHLGIARADVFGFSLGGITGLRLAIRRPELVRKLVAASVIYSNEGYYASIVAGWPSLSQQALLTDPGIRSTYFAVADPITIYGLPMAPLLERDGVLVLRAQRGIIQKWLVDAPWARVGQVTVANAGDLAKEANLFPYPVALQASPPPPMDCRSATFAYPRGTKDTPIPVPSETEVAWIPDQCVLTLQSYQHGSPTPVRDYKNVVAGGSYSLGDPGSGLTELKIWVEGPGGGLAEENNWVDLR